MIEVKKFVVNMLQENCYVVSDETKDCVIIDCGAFYPEERQAIVDYIRGNELKPKHLLATHGHLDHNFGNDTIYNEFKLQLEISSRDENLVNSLAAQAKKFYDMTLEIEYPPIGHFFEENEMVEFGTHKLKVLETPGHSKGCVCFWEESEGLLFSGDTLFRNSIGRTDLGGGSMMQIIQSLRFLAQLPDQTVVLPGHGPQTTIGEELAHNPYIDR